MTYAAGRVCFDADSHLMETSDWLEGYADAGIRDRIRPLALGGAGALAEQALADAEARRGDADAAAQLEGALMSAKGWNALGAVDPGERSRALDLLGFEQQLVFSTFAATQFGGKDLELLYGGTRALNRAMADFCASDARLLPVGFLPLADVALAEQELDAALELGCAAIQVPSVPAAGKSPAHPELNGIWSRLQEAGVPFVLHVGGGGRGLNPKYHDNGKPRTTDFLGGGENIRSKDYMVLHHSPETFLAVMVLDGVFEEFPGLRGGCIELGAMWVVPWMRRLDLAQEMFSRTEPALNLPLRPSEYVRRQLKFTPFATEPVGWMIENAGEELFLFSSDYPHPEGGRDPLARFEASMGDVDGAAQERFYSGNFAELVGASAAR